MPKITLTNCLSKGKRHRNGPKYFTMFMSELIATGTLMFLGCMGCVPEVDNPPAVHHMSSLSFGLVVLLIIQGFGHISGAHLNPAVTICALLTNIVTPIMAVVYIIAQFIGAILGFALLKILIPKDYSKPGFCMTLPNTLLTTLQALAIETIITTILIIIICAVWDKRNADKSDSVPLRFGFVLVAISMVAGPFTGASMNTVRTFAPAVLEGNFQDQWIYWVAPNIGAVLGTGLYKYLFSEKEEESTAEENIQFEDDIQNNPEKI
ncbi:aquaporin-like isoform X2 [Anoplophora glabripennis]|uniref:aquaporin-like isoform X2 n=1 Tax=Anoplophora glabripennis TaxID=217634 RepID=UPI000874A090|nr:aquaporin-like isoform X2 [Anoplophora glabripennis]